MIGVIIKIMIFSKKPKREYVKLIYNYCIKFVTLLFQIILILFYFIFAAFKYANDIFYFTTFLIACAASIIIMFYARFKEVPFWICITKGDILKYLDNLDKKGENDKLYLIYKINEKSLSSSSSFKSYFLANITIICLLLTFTDKSRFNIEKFSKINLNYIFNYRFIFIEDDHFWFCIILAIFYYCVFIFIRRRNISKIFFKYFDLQSFKRK